MSTSSFRCQLKCHQLRSCLGSHAPLFFEKLLISWKCWILPRNGLFCFVLLFAFWPCHSACRILFPWPGIKPRPMALKMSVLTTGPPGESHDLIVDCGFSSLHWHQEGAMKRDAACLCLQEPSTVLPKAGSQSVLREWTGNKVTFKILCWRFYFFSLE